MQHLLCCYLIRSLLTRQFYGISVWGVSRSHSLHPCLTKEGREIVLCHVHTVILHMILVTNLSPYHLQWSKKFLCQKAVLRLPLSKDFITLLWQTPQAQAHEEFWSSPNSKDNGVEWKSISLAVCLLEKRNFQWMSEYYLSMWCCCVNLLECYSAYGWHRLLQRKPHDNCKIESKKGVLQASTSPGVTQLYVSNWLEEAWHVTSGWKMVGLFTRHWPAEQ